MMQNTQSQFRDDDRKQTQRGQQNSTFQQQMKKELSIEEQIMEQKISPVEERALQKVFKRLCNATPKNNSQQENTKSNTLKKDMNENYFTLKDLAFCLTELDYPYTKQEIDQMIWEIDEKLSGKIGWHEFQLCYKRCAFDKSGLEPRSLYNVIQFLMYLTPYNNTDQEDINNENKFNINDDDDEGQKKIKKTITSEDTLELLYVRYGRVLMNQEIEEIFGEQQQNSDGEDIQINLEEYLKKIKKKDFQERQRREKERKNVQDPTVDKFYKSRM
ncbi:hypothetical protein PPERSA_00048 [Pseudocohnilembus persalinus]|uniref:EF-hand domain-containing protein n=1 Tax=Pseudocohnilembus persalinus TaxID=266149 RepID=A0A0V0Q8I9_PSEPJ|nr:hypothetical protein PPERSA_00048 [Pseudocohnilembus persalinus]|eukprot:KRW98556.1 hypothetical protein PPERSA_00048 [Pseudocohnilembus persalinus]